MRIVLFTYNFSGNAAGISKINQKVVEHLIRKHEVHVICQRKNVVTQELLDPFYIKKNLFVHRIKREKSLKGTIHYYKQARKLCSQIRPDIVYENGLSGLGLFSGYPYVLHIQGNAFFKPGNLKWFIKSILFQADCVICPNQYTAFVARKKGVNNVKIIPSGVNLTAFKPTKKYEEFTAVCVTRLISSKNVRTSIEACAMSKTPLVVIGDGPERESLERFASLKGAKVKFLGMIPNKKVLNELMKCHVLLHPTQHPETGMIAVVEAMAAGLPILLSNIPSCMEFVNSFDNGFCFPSNNSIPFKSCLLSLKNRKNYWQKLSQASKKASKNFNEMDMVRDIESTLKEAYENQTLRRFS